jgi:abelson tyrosine-protein kinase 1
MAFSLQHVAKAAASVLDTAKLVAHEALFTGVDLLRFAPIPMLEIAGMTLINIWEALESVEVRTRALLCPRRVVTVRR